MRSTLVLAILALGGAARAQGFSEGGDVDRGRQGDDATLLKMRVDLTGGAYLESQYGDAPIPNTSISSPNSIFYVDVRGKLDARHISGSSMDFLGDLRIRLNPDPTAPSRGYQGGQEFDLKEVYGVYRGDSTDFALGRIVLREVDAQTIDGATLVFRTASRWELGLFGGLYPDPFSRSVEDDYKVITYDDAGLPTGDELIDPIPMAAGGWAGYRYVNAYGAVGLMGVLPRNDDPPPTMPMAPPRSENRALLTSNGYWRTGEAIDVIHYLVLEARSSNELPTLINGQLVGHWKASPRVLLEGGVSRMSSYAVEVYLRDLLERYYPFVDDMGNPLMCDPGLPCVQNNLDVIRIASNEARVGGNYLFPALRLDVNGQLRYREREGLVLPEGLPIFPADRQVEASLGARKRELYAGFDVSGSAVIIRGRRAFANVFGVRGTRQLSPATYLELDGGYSQYEDGCRGSNLDPRTCEGTARGFTYRLGALGTWQRDQHWLFIADYHANLNKAKAMRNGVVNVYPYYAGHAFFFRAQYRY